MGTYLSTPVLDKGIEEGEDLDGTMPVAWGVVDMQGWRKSMEDAHICAPVFDKENGASLFAVFDGHGGSEVALYCE